MNVFRELSLLPAGPRIFALGSFDGVHLGHRKVLRELVSWAETSGAASCVITFASHPRARALITPVAYKLELLSREGVREVAAVQFSELKDLRAAEFLHILNSLGGRGLVLGTGARFGRGREGDALAARASGFEVREIEPFTLSGSPVSSTRIRASLRRGDVEGARALLGRRPGLRGKVVKGEGRGAELGFPTANIEVEPDLCASMGVFASLTVLGGKELPGATYVGKRPTFGGGGLIAETHLFDFSGELCGEELEVLLVARLRGDRTFGSAEELARHIPRDIERARELLGVA